MGIHLVAEILVSVGKARPRVFYMPILQIILHFIVSTLNLHDLLQVNQCMDNAMISTSPLVVVV